MMPRLGRQVVGTIVLLGTLLAGLAALPAPALAAGDDNVRVAAVSISGVPRSLVTIAVAVPLPIADAAELTYSVELRSEIEVLGRLSGPMRRDEARGEWRPILLTLRVPSDARVGIINVADVTFRDGTGRSVVQPIILRVPAVLALAIEGPIEVANLRQGDRLTLDYRVRNTGNAPETVLIRFEPPFGWLGRAPDTLSVLVPPYASTDVQLALRVPASNGGGEYRIIASIFASGAEDSLPRGNVNTRLRVRDLEIRSNGLMLRPIAVAASTRDGFGVGTGLRLDGPVADGVTLRAQLIPGTSATGLQALALASMGTLGNPFQATLTGPTWNVNAGMVSAQLSPLTGVNAVAEGVSGSARVGTRTVQAFAGRSGLRGAATGSHVGAGVSWPSSVGQLGASVSRMRESFGSAFSRELSALGAEWANAAGSPWQLDGGLAVRHFAGGSHLGYRFQAAQAGSRSRLRFGFSHAPGGSNAFANGVDNLSADYSRSLNERWRLDINASAITDLGGAGFESRSRTVGVGQQYDLNERTSLNLRGTTSRFDASAASEVGTGAFGATANIVSGGATHRWREWSFGTSMEVGVVGRSVELLSGGMSEVRVMQRGAQVSSSRSFPSVGVLTAGLGRTLTGAGAGQPTDVTSAYSRLNGVPVMIAGLPVGFDADVQYVSSPEQASRIGLRLGARAPLPGGMEVALSAERNPFFLDRNGRAGWLMALRVSGATSVFSPRRGGIGGMVFEDANSNGVRDPGEVGVGGVTVRYGEARMTARRDGTYDVPAGVRGRMTVDPASVPIGLVLHPRIAAALDEQRDLPLVPTGTVTLTLAIAADADGRRPVADLSRAEVWLVDADGRQWAGRTIGTGEYRFENVPTGTYEVNTDLSAVAEPLRVTAGDVLTVRKFNPDVHIVQLQGRAIRMMQPPSRGGSGGGRGGRASRSFSSGTGGSGR